jgi:hypothetical protein
MNQLLFEQFVVADSAQVLCSTLFYELKKEILKSEGTPAGFEIVVVREFCNKCNGTGERFVRKMGTKGKKLPCISCGATGFYKNEKRFYQRYALHGMIFKQRIQTQPAGEPVEIHQGYPKKDSYAEPKTAYRAMLILFARYNEGLLNRLLSVAYPAQEIWAEDKQQILKLIEELKAA